MARSGDSVPVSVLSVRVVPRSSRPGVLIWENGTARVHLNAPPVEGKANRELIALVSKVLGIPRSSVEIRSGTRGRDKTVRITGLAQDILEAKLAQFAPKEV
ncbi:MAG TPA: DUF167 domain-containing protein [bacterium]|nr:DUF167 domain-containing protein [bacterium]HQL63823.1 DUF167 domain-containing protein [bacterium]